MRRILRSTPLRVEADAGTGLSRRSVASQWLPAALAFKRVLIASDADDAGEVAARAWQASLQSFGARCARFTPCRAKDWSEALQRDGRDATATHAAARLAQIRQEQWL